MKKLNELLVKQAELQEETKSLGLFLDRVTGKGTLHMVAEGEEGADAIEFTPSDLALELQVLTPVYAYNAKRLAELDEVNAKVDALELLLN